EDSHDVCSFGSSGERSTQDDPDIASGTELRCVFSPDRHARWCLRMPDAVEGSECRGRLVVGAAFACDDDHRLRAAQTELQTDVIGPEGLHLPVDENDLAGDVDAGELTSTAAARVDQLASNAARACLGHAAEGRAVVALRPDLDVR